MSREEVDRAVTAAHEAFNRRTRSYVGDQRRAGHGPGNGVMTKRGNSAEV
jgi:hypothetical protein